MSDNLDHIETGRVWADREWTLQCSCGETVSASDKPGIEASFATHKLMARAT